MPAEKIRTVTKSRTRAAKTDQTSRNTTATRIIRTKNYNKEYNKDYNRDKDNGRTDTQ